MTIKFNDSPNLGQTIENKTLISFGATPLKSLNELAFVAGANKFSQLCGFRFISKAPHQYKEFYISFVCKLRSDFYRQKTNPSQWYIFKKISPFEFHVLSKQQLFDQYNFDINEFYNSDLFKKGTQLFKTTIEHGLTQQIPELSKQYKNDSIALENIEKYKTAISKSLPLLTTTITNNKFYKLINYDLKIEKELDQKIEEALQEIYN